MNYSSSQSEKNKELSAEAKHRNRPEHMSDEVTVMVTEQRSLDHPVMGIGQPARPDESV
ncbi:MAG: hypothetical protein HND49_08480 [Planctomycetes bacterium]|nr:hypothetical protein [Planctomycetota bacterium]